MRLTESVSFWIIIFSAIIGFLVGQIHWILGVIVFVLIAGRSAIYGLVMDTIYGSLEYHHDREDRRAKKKMESVAFLKYGVQGKNNKSKMYSDGSMYVGQYKDGKPNGQGTYTRPNGSQYVGQYKNGKRNGQGTMTLPDGTQYVGQWKNDEMNGQGTLNYPDGAQYVGQWKDGKPNGQGTFTWSDGSKYVGQFKDGEYDGQGTLTSSDGSEYAGQWKNGDYIGR